MKEPLSYSDDPRRLSAAALLDTLFSPTARPVSEILKIARDLETHSGIGFFKLPVPYDIKTDSNVIRTGFSDSMGRAVSSIIADLDTMSPDTHVVVDMDAARIPKAQTLDR